VKNNLGYYFADSKYGQHFKEVKRYAPLYRTSILDFKTSDMPYKRARLLFREHLIAAKPKSIILSLDWDRQQSRDEFDAVKVVRDEGLWDKVWVIEVQDEPGYTAVQGSRILNEIFSGLDNLGVSAPAFGLGVVEGIEGLINSDGWKEFHWVGLEAYVDPPGRSIGQNRKALRSDMRTMRNLVDETPLDFFWVMQGYDRNGGWPNDKTRLALQSDTFSLMRTKKLRATLPITTIFSYSRPGGSREHSELKESHRSYVYGTRT